MFCGHTNVRLSWPIAQPVEYLTVNPATRVRFPVSIDGTFHLDRKSRRSTQPRKMSTGGNRGAKLARRPHKAAWN